MIVVFVPKLTGIVILSSPSAPIHLRLNAR
jgi:hypothetical protein